MSRWPRLIAALAVRNLLHLTAVAWVSVIWLLCRFVRPDVIAAVGPAYWLLAVMSLFLLLYVIWISALMATRANGQAAQTRSG